jgi:hypothetical protein
MKGEPGCPYAADALGWPMDPLLCSMLQAPALYHTGSCPWRWHTAKGLTINTFGLDIEHLH